MKNSFDCNVKKISDSCYKVDNGLAIYYYFDEKCAVLHRVDEPAIEFKTGEKHYYLHGMRHNISGPAVIYQEVKQYWLNDIQYSQEDFEIKKLKLEKKLLKDVQPQS